MKNENNAHCKFAYKCGICGKEYDEPVNRAKCEIACTEKKEEEERQAALRKKEAEYGKRKEEVDNAFNTAYVLKEKFVKDYGSYSYGWGLTSTEQPSIWRFFV